MVGFLNFQLSSAYRVKIGRQFYNRTRKAKPLILINFIEAVTRKRVRLDSSYEEADLLLLSGADLRDAVDERKGLVSGGDEPTLERVAFEMSGGGKVLIVSFENHQHPYWEDFGDQLMRSNLPRLTFYPSEIDSRGKGSLIGGIIWIGLTSLGHEQITSATGDFTIWTSSCSLFPWLPIAGKGHVGLAPTNRKNRGRAYSRERSNNLAWMSTGEQGFLFRAQSMKSCDSTSIQSLLKTVMDVVTTQRKCLRFGILDASR